MGEGKYYWLKLKRDFFKRHDIRIIESMQNGTEYILFYLKLLCESVDHEGNLRFSENIPYNDEMLSTITNTNVDIVRSAVKVFTELGMMEILDDGTFFMTEVQKMIGSASNSESAIKQKRYRDRLKQSNVLLPDRYSSVTDDVTESNGDVTESVTENNESKSKNKSKRENKRESKNNNMPIPDDKPQEDLREEFEELWSMYPRKLGNKETAFRDYKKARKEGTTKADVLIGINNYKAYIHFMKIDKEYIMYGSTFFHGKRWNDDFSIAKTKSNNKFNDIEQHEYTDAEWEDLEERCREQYEDYYQEEEA